METIYVKRWQSPVGGMLIGSVKDTLCLCDWVFESRRSTIDNRICRILKAEIVEGSTPIIEKAIAELEEYFAGRRKEFDLPITFAGTPFQCQVWHELLKIPYGTTISYSALATRIGNPKAVRAVANANATNPISIFVPCHRVIGADNTLTGYGGGLPAKKALLAIEGLQYSK